MIARVVIAAIGGLIVTGTLLLGMQAVTSLFQNRPTERYYRITDILPKPVPDRPERPEPGVRQPESASPEFVPADPGISVEQPSPIGSSPRPPAPAIERPDVPERPEQP